MLFSGDTKIDSVHWLAANSTGKLEEIAKQTQDTRAWFAVIGERPVFAKWYPLNLRDLWVITEISIAGANLHPNIIPLRQRVDVADGTLLIYDRVNGENLGPMDVRRKFQALPLAERANVVLAVSDALAAVCEAGFMVVDWYEGNMLYDFDARQIWLFDWELCRLGSSFVLEMDSNYGSSRLMAPEEFVRGSRLDQKTLVYNLGRYALLTLPELAEPLAPFLARATYPARAERYETVQEFGSGLRDALSRIQGADR